MFCYYNYSSFDVFSIQDFSDTMTNIFSFNWLINYIHNMLICDTCVTTTTMYFFFNDVCSRVCFHKEENKYILVLQRCRNLIQMYYFGMTMKTKYSMFILMFLFLKTVRFAARASIIGWIQKRLKILKISKNLDNFASTFFPEKKSPGDTNRGPLFCLQHFPTKKIYHGVLIWIM